MATLPSLFSALPQNHVLVNSSTSLPTSSNRLSVCYYRGCSRVEVSQATRALSEKKGSLKEEGLRKEPSRRPVKVSALVSRCSLLTTMQSGRRSNGGSTRCKASSQGGDVPPDSREEAIEQAAASIWALLEKALKRQGPSTVKQRKEQRQVRLRVEIPVLDESPYSLISLTLDLLSALSKAKKGAPSVAVVFQDGAAVDLARELCAKDADLSSTTFLNLQIERVSGDEPVVLVVGAKIEDNPSVQELAKNVSPRPIVILNPEWSPEDEKDAAWGSLLTSFEVAYSFVPLSIQGFFSKTEGAVLKHVKSGAPGGRPWLIFVKENDSYKRVSSVQRRPHSSDLESALYNAMAANSPVTKSIKFLRGLVSKE